MPHTLDDRTFVTRLDPRGMLRLTEEFPAQCREALAIAQAASLTGLEARPSVAVLTGMGGSAAGGDFARAVFEAYGTTPFLVNRDYHMPHCVGLADLVFAASYSGNTEETLSAYADAHRAGARIICVTSGGKIADLAQADGHDVIRIPGGQPPRTALGFMLIPVLVAAERLKLIPEQDYEAAFSLLERLAAEWTVEAPYASNQTKQLAEALHGGLPVIYGLGSWQAVVANRWKGQINENSKTMAFANGFPELNHNEILGWVGAGGQSVGRWVGIMLEGGEESEKVKARARVTEGLIGATAEFHHVAARGDSLLSKMLSLAFFADFTSIYLAALYGVDPENIDSIDTLKRELAKVS
jgi:glucose/mannose-6-phosphate isomerase